MDPETLAAVFVGVLIGIPAGSIVFIGNLMWFTKHFAKEIEYLTKEVERLRENTITFVRSTE
jgi:hypothetical protein